MKIMKPNPKKMIGKTILVGMTYYTKDNELVEQKQFWGTIVLMGGNSIIIRQNNGEEISIPNDMSAIKTAAPGEYRLRTTGEVVINPDYLSVWNVTLPDES